jgi:hypothetical protein
MWRRAKQRLIKAGAERVKTGSVITWCAAGARASGQPIEEIESAKRDRQQGQLSAGGTSSYHSFKRVERIRIREPATVWRRWLIGDTTPVRRGTIHHSADRRAGASTGMPDMTRRAAETLRRIQALPFGPGIKRFYPYGDTGTISHQRMSHCQQRRPPRGAIGQDERRPANVLISRTGVGKKLAEPLLR